MINIFETELEKGTGIPYILIKNEIVKASPEVDSILLDNILNCTAYDPQCEGLRSEYMYSIVENYPNRAAVYKGVLDFFEKMTDTDWGDQQTFAFVCILAEKNIADKKIIYEKIRWYIENEKDDLYTMYDFAEKEGFEASQFVAHELGKLLEKNPEYSLACYDGFFRNFHNKDEVLSFLKKCDDKYIHIYLQNIEDTQIFKPSKRKSADEIIEKFYKKNEWYYLLGLWLRKSDYAEIKKLTDYVLQSENQDFKYRFISMFDEVRIPVSYEILRSEYLKAKKLDYKIQILEAMLLFEKSEAKEFILDLDFDNRNVIELYIKALCLFYTKDENEILLEKIDSLDIYSCHDILSFLINNENLKNDLEFFKKIVYKIYHKNKCSLCRSHIFDKMIETRILDKAICEEAMHDCNENIAKAAKTFFQNEFA